MPDKNIFLKDQNRFEKQDDILKFYILIHNTLYYLDHKSLLSNTDKGIYYIIQESNYNILFDLIYERKIKKYKEINLDIEYFDEDDSDIKYLVKCLNTIYYFMNEIKHFGFTRQGYLNTFNYLLKKMYNEEYFNG